MNEHEQDFLDFLGPQLDEAMRDCRELAQDWGEEPTRR
jgi:hypothetical protein